MLMLVWQKAGLEMAGLTRAFTSAKFRVKCQKIRVRGDPFALQNIFIDINTTVTASLSLVYESRKTT